MPTAETIGPSVQNELTFRQMVDGISALVAVLTPDGAVEFVNRQVLDYFGKTLDELKVWESTDAVHPDDLPAGLLYGSGHSRTRSPTTLNSANGARMAPTGGSMGKGSRFGTRRDASRLGR